jgi:tRNA uridine 5-carbamoylmethylation protein Kti12
MSNTIYFLKGLPASGKTTYAEYLMVGRKSAKSVVRVNKDDLRSMFFMGEYSKENEHFVQRMRNQIVHNALKDDKDVVVDDTNYNPKHYETIKQIAEEHNARIKIVEMDTPLAECIERNRKRDNPVPERVVWDMYEKYILPDKVKNRLFQSDKQNAVWVDIDGTLAIHGERSPFDYKYSLEDKVNDPVADLVRELSHNYLIIIATGRENIIYDDGQTVKDYTCNWMDLQQIPYDYVYIRDFGDNRHDYIVKKEMLDDMDKYFNIKWAIDDRKQVVDMLRGEGVTVLDIAGHTY